MPSPEIHHACPCIEPIALLKSKIVSVHI